MVTATPGRRCALFQRDAQGKPIIPRDIGSLYSFGILIRKTEELLLRLFSEGLLSGTTHTCLGQELCAISVVRALSSPYDAVVSNHRNHGHFLTYSGDFDGLVGEVMGRESGVCGGIGGSQHIAFRRFHSNGVQGGMTGIGVGHALALKRRNQDGVVAILIGDGTLGQGLVYESMNLASVWGAPALFVVEHNGIAQTTPTADTVGGSIEARGKAFGLDTWSLDDSDPEFIGQVEEVVGEVRSRRKPGFLVIGTRRLGPHSKGDDTREASELDAIRARDPLARLGGLLGQEYRNRMDAAADEFLAEVYRQAAASSEAAFRENGPRFFACCAAAPAEPRTQTEAPANVRASLNHSLSELLAGFPNVLLLGEDLHDPYGGAFR